MQTPLHITFRHLMSSATLQTRIRESLEQVERLSEDIISCRVVISAPSSHHIHGSPFTIRVELSIPGRRLCVDTERVHTPSHADVYVAGSDAFSTLRRMLQNHSKHVHAKRRCVTLSAVSEVG